MSEPNECNTTATPRRQSPVGAILKFVIPVMISIGLCWLLFRDDSLSDMLLVIRTKCDFRWIGLMLAVGFMSYVFRALRWGIQLDGVGVRTPFIQLLYSIFGTYATNLVFPRLGEIWRSGFIAHRENAPFGTVFGTMIADRFADLITGLLFTLFTLITGHHAISAFVHRYPDGYRNIVSLATSPWTIALITLVSIAAFMFFRNKSGNSLINRARNFIRELWLGFTAILHIRRKGMWMLWTVLLWGCYFGEMILAFQAFPFTRVILAENGLSAVLVCFTLGTIAMGIPSNGGIGPYQIAVIFGLSLYCPDGLDNATQKAFELDSKAFANLILTMSTLLTIIVGLWAFTAIAIGKKRPRQAE